MFSTCFLILPRSEPTLPHIVHLWLLGPSFTIYSYSCFESSPAIMNSVFHYRLFGLDKLKLFPMHTTHEMIQLVATRRVLGAIFAVVHKHSVKIFILNVFSSYFSKSWLCRTGCICDFEDHPSQCSHTIAFGVLPCKHQLQSPWIFSVFKSAQKLLLVHTMVVQHSQRKGSLGNLPTHSHYMVV